MNINNLEKPTSVQVANGETISIGGVGSVKLENDLAQVEFRDVDLVEGLATNLISVRQLAKRGARIVFDGDTVEVYDKKTKKLIMKTTKKWR